MWTQVVDDHGLVCVVGAQPGDQAFDRALARGCRMAAPVHVGDMRVRAAVEQSDRDDLNQLDSPGAVPDRTVVLRESQSA